MRRCAEEMKVMAKKWSCAEQTEVFERMRRCAEQWK